MKFVKIFLAVCLLFFIVSAIGLISLLIFVDPNKLKPIIVAEVFKKSGYQLLIDGNLSWSFYPKLSVKVDKMSLKMPEQTSPFIQLYKVAIAADPLQMLQGKQTLRGDIYIDQIEFMKINLKNAKIGVHWQSDVLMLQPFTASLYNGTLSGVVKGATFSSVPRWDADLQFNKIQAQPLLQDIYGRDSKLSLIGTTNAALQASTFGSDRKQILSNLNGLSHVNIRDGALTGIDVSYFVEGANALIRHESLENIQNTRQTPFTNFTGSATIKNGVANSNDILFTSSLFVTKASGVIDLTNQMIDYQLQVLPIRTGKIKWAVPLLLTGDLHNPNIHLDKLKLELLIAKDQLEEVKSKINEEVKELPSKADKFLKKLIGG